MKNEFTNLISKDLSKENIEKDGIYNYPVIEKMIMDNKATQLMDEGKPWKPKSGIDYWINAPLIRTSSQKYDYMNYIQLIGKGVIADLSAGYVTYNLYKVLYSK